MNTRMLTIALVSAGLAATPALAIARDNSAMNTGPELGPYIGAGYGVTFIDKICDSSKDEPIDCKHTDGTWRGIIGARLTPYFGLQASYVHLADFNKHIGTLNGHTKIDGPSASLVGYLPFNRYVSFFAKGGMYFWKVKSDVATGGSTLTQRDEHGNDPVAGAGIQASLTDHVKLQLEYDRYFNVGDKDTTGQSDVDTVSANAIYQF